jgi:uncharacterized protein YbaR (Trm112 family)
VHIEFIDLLRCPEPHEESWLVAAFHRMEGRNVINAKLGCPVCNAEYFIRDGIAVFGDGISGARPAAMDPAHIAAFLNLTSPGKTILLAGAFAAYSAAVSLATEARAISLNADHPGRLDQVAEVRAGPRVPLAANSLDGIALDESHSTQEFLAEAQRVLRSGGRLLMPGSSKLPAAVHELARDSHHIVAERVTELITLGRKN